MDLCAWIEGHARQMPDKLALRFPGRDYSFAQVATLVDQLVGALATGGVNRGQCVAYLGFNSPEMLALLFACSRLGAMFMPLNWRLAGPEHRQMLEDCPPTVIFVDEPFVAQTQQFVNSLADAKRVSFGPSVRGWTSYDYFVSRGQGIILPDAQFDPQAPLLICYTSGSTGKPKGVLLSNLALEINAANSIDMHELDATDRILTTLPLFHVGGLNILTTPAVQAGASVVLHPKFDPDAAFDAIERERITLTVLVPAQLEMMLANPRWQTADLSSLRAITTGSSIVPEKLIRAVHARGIPLIQVYGSTETCPVATYQKLQDAYTKVGSAGRPAANCEVCVVADDGRVLATGESGEILVRGANVMSGYWQAPELTASALQGGWYRSGDMGHWDEDGFLFVDGRKKEMIISGGENIYPAEIENVLIECDAVAEAAVVGRRDERWGETVVAVIVPKAGANLTREQVLQLFEGRIARYKHPKDVVFVGEMPKTALGKIRKEEVRNLAGDHALRQP